HRPGGHLPVQAGLPVQQLRGRLRAGGGAVRGALAVQHGLPAAAGRARGGAVSGTRALKWGGILFLLIPIILVDLFPLVVMVSTSLKTQQEVFQQPPTFIPRQPTLRNYADIWQAVSLATYFQNSLLIGLGAMALAMLLAVPASYALARFRFKGRLAYLLFLLVIQMFPSVVII